MPNRPFPEFLLALFAGRTRAAAIYGDLEELALTRGRLWFWSAYARTVVALSWRTPVALAAVLASIRYVRSIVIGRFISLSHPSISTNLQFVHTGPGHYVFLVYRWLGWIGWLHGAMWLLLPYIAIRFGSRSRLCYLACALFLAGLPAYFFRPIPTLISQVASAVIATCALASPRWRRPMIFLAINSAIATAIYFITIVLPDPHDHGPSPWGIFGMRIDELILVVVTLLIAPPLHRWLLASPENSIPDNAGATHA